MTVLQCLIIIVGNTVLNLIFMVQHTQKLKKNHESLRIRHYQTVKELSQATAEIDSLRIQISQQKKIVSRLVDALENGFGWHLLEDNPEINIVRVSGLDNQEWLIPVQRKETKPNDTIKRITNFAYLPPAKK